MEMSFFYCVLPASGLHHPVDDGRQAADLAGLPAQAVRHRSFFAHHKVRLHLTLALDRDRTPELRLVSSVYQDLHRSQYGFQQSFGITWVRRMRT